MMVIAEAGSNHGGTVDGAIELVRIAASAGADVVKFQFIFPSGLYLPEYLESDGTYSRSAVWEARQTEELTSEEWAEVWSEATRLGIAPAASVFCERGIDLLETLGTPFVKIASTDLTNLGLLAAAAKKFNQIVLSTGMASSEEIDASVNFLNKECGSPTVRLMHCVSRYPCPLEASAPHRVTSLRDKFGLEVGYSDHTEGVGAALMAVACGARFFEKHFTFDKSAPGFDHKHAASPGELTAYISALREGIAAVEKDPWNIAVEERETAIRARRGTYLRRDVAAGESISADDLLYVRPSTQSATSPHELGPLLAVAQTDMKRFQAVSLTHNSIEPCMSNHERASEYWVAEMREKKMVE